MTTRYEIPLDLWPPVRDELLGEIARSEDAAGRGMLSVLVVHKRDGMPGQGFFKLAAELGRDAADPMKLWSDELKRVYHANARGR